ncbi:MAG: class I SAM-dependent methyltransferase [Spirochaetales bacterium]
MSTQNEWFKNENFWLQFAPIMFDEQRWSEASTVAQEICKLANLTQGNTILDAGCGPGRISIELALCGLEVTGIDLIGPFLAAAQESANDENVNITLIQSDLRYFDGQYDFDAAVNLYTSFGYCNNIDDDALILQRIAKSLKQGGIFILECLSREIAVRDFTEGEWFERAGKTVLTRFSVEGAWEGLRSDWTLIDNDTGERMRHVFVQRLYSATDLRTLLLANGFSTCEIYGDFNKSPYNEKARTTVLLCKK